MDTNNVFLANLNTGTVQTVREWTEDFEDIPEHEREMLWGGKSFWDANLVPVEQDNEGNWVEMKEDCFYW